jgi:hypothetical protein
MSESGTTVVAGLAGVPTASTGKISTPALIHAMIHAGKGVSDLILSPGRPPQVEMHGHLTAVKIAELPLLQPADTARIASDLIGGNKQAMPS